MQPSCTSQPVDVHGDPGVSLEISGWGEGVDKGPMGVGGLAVICDKFWSPWAGGPPNTGQPCELISHCEVSD